MEDSTLNVRAKIDGILVAVYVQWVFREYPISYGIIYYREKLDIFILSNDRTRVTLQIFLLHSFKLQTI